LKQSKIKQSRSDIDRMLFSPLLSTDQAVMKVKEYAKLGQLTSQQISSRQPITGMTIRESEDITSTCEYLPDSENAVSKIWHRSDLVRGGEGDLRLAYRVRGQCCLPSEGLLPAARLVIYSKHTYLR
jgi:hypothetical protein